MRSVHIIIFILSHSVCFSQTEIPTAFKKLEWLAGTWNQTEITEPGKVAYEVWQKASNQQLVGYGVTLQDQDTVFIEKFSILVKDNSIYYVADVPENKQLVYFKLSMITDFGFVCENPDHDFPKKIIYQFDGITLKAQISGNGKFINYLFKRQ